MRIAGLWNRSSTAFAIALIAVSALTTEGGEGSDAADNTIGDGNSIKAAEIDAESLARIRAKREKISQPFDQPDGAEAFYQLKRTPIDDGSLDVDSFDAVEHYRVAREQMQQMPRYSIRRGALIDAEELEPDSALKAELETWRPLGPGNIGGRTRALVIHPNQPGTLWAAGVSGGIWKTTNGGGSWQPLADLLPNLAVGSLAIDPSNPQILYAGTGEGVFREVVRGTSLPLRGAGIFKSVNGGASWARLSGTVNSNFHWVNDLVVSSNDSQRIYAATRSGVWRSTNGGSSWARVLASAENGGCLDLALRTDLATDTLFAACGTLGQGRIYRNPAAEGGGGWQSVFTEGGMGRTSLAIALSNQNIVYALSASFVGGPGGRFDGGLHAVFRSDQGGAPGSWTARVRNSDPNKLNTLILTNPVVANLQECGFSGTNSYSNLGWYANTIAVDPTNPEIVWAGGIDLFRSDDGGLNWGVVSHWFASPATAHADQHQLVFHPNYNGGSNQTLFLAGDGGIYRSTNARAAKGTGSQASCSPNTTSVVWTPLNNGYGVTQFYHGAPYPDGRQFLGGTQDNGTLRGSLAGGINGWSRILGGDGGYVAIDPTNTNILYAETQRLGFRKSVDGGANFELATNGISETADDVLFITPFTMDSNDSRRLWTGGRRLWRTNNAAASWSQASAALPGGGKVSAIAIDPSSSNRVLVGSDLGFILRQQNALTTGASSTWPATRPRSGFVSWVAIDPQNPNVAYATYAGFGGAHVFRSVDGGGSWAAIDGAGSGRLPDIPVHGIVVDPTDSQRLFLATDLGVFVSTDGGQRWAVENTGFANAVTESLTLSAGPGGEPNLYAFTHGRGAWRVELAVGAPGTLRFDRDAVTAAEDEAGATFTVTRIGGTNGTVSVDYATGGGTAIAGEDYAATSGTLTWPSNDATAKTFTVPLFDDFEVEGLETVNLTLSNPTGGASLGSPSTSTLSLIDNDVTPGECIASETALCLGGGRFRVEIAWTNPAGESGPGRVVPDATSDDSGLIWFFSPTNWEMLIKVLDGCSITGHYWVLFAATTDVGFTLTVTDTERGQFNLYQNPVGSSADAVIQTDAFATCP